MKKIVSTIGLILCTLLLVVSMTGCKKEPTSTDYQVDVSNIKPPTQDKQVKAITGFKKYGVKSGIIEYKTTGEESSTSTVYFDNYGQKEAQFKKSTVKVSNGEVVLNELQLQIGTKVYQINQDAGTGTIASNKVIELALLQAKDGDLIAFNDALFTSAGGAITGTEDILGREANVWDMPALRATIWMWNGIELKNESRANDQLFITEAISFEEDAEIDQSLFEIPEDIEFTEVN